LLQRQYKHYTSLRRTLRLLQQYATHRSKAFTGLVREVKAVVTYPRTLTSSVKIANNACRKINNASVFRLQYYKPLTSHLIQHIQHIQPIQPTQLINQSTGFYYPLSTRVLRNQPHHQVIQILNRIRPNGGRYMVVTYPAVVGKKGVCTISGNTHKT